MFVRLIVAAAACWCLVLILAWSAAWFLAAALGHRAGAVF